jgi:glycosyltransferase involved in cell wall biosynthesis
MLYFDLTKAAEQKHHSGLMRVSACLYAALHARLPAEALTDVAWNPGRGTFVSIRGRRPMEPAAGDWIFTPELFSEEERPGLTAWLARRPCRVAALYHDSIPLKYPHWTWPQSVARHPHYLRLLAGFDAVFADSRASAAELAAYWKWAGFSGPTSVALELGANGLRTPRAIPPAPGASPRSAARSLVMVGILEPRKNQMAALDAAETLWRGGVDFSLRLVGRVNPHFGQPVVTRLRALARAGCPVRHDSDLDDGEVAQLLAGARLLLLPSLAEGCGLPVLEALWAGVPVVCSDIPPVLESAAGGGCRVVPAGDTGALTAAVRELLADDSALDQLAYAALRRPLPVWAGTAHTLLAGLGVVR